MTTDQNPFRPGFSSMPPVLAGRSPFKDAMATVFAATSLHPRAFVVLTGQRGIGKTVLAEAVCSRGPASRLAHRLLGRPHRRHHPRRHHQELAGYPAQASRSSAAVTITGATHRQGRRQRRRRLGKHGDLVGQPDRQPHRLRTLAPRHRRDPRQPPRRRTARHRRSPERPHRRTRRTRRLHVGHGTLRATTTPPAPIKLAVLFAGLPAFRTVAAKAMSFSAERLTYVALEALSATETSAALAVPIANAGRTISNEVLEYLIVRSGGYPYFIQLHGYHTWESAGDATALTLEHAEAGHLVARSEYEASLFQARLAKLPNLPLAMLYAVAIEADDTHTALTRQVADRLQRSSR